MRQFSSDSAFTPAVKGIQAEKGSRSSYSRIERGGSWETTVTPELEAFLADLDMFYLGTANAEGQPYIQYRGGSPGFLKKLDEKTLGFADFGGNRQYITLGNLSENPQAFIFLMDYAYKSPRAHVIFPSRRSSSRTASSTARSASSAGRRSFRSKTASLRFHCLQS